MRAEGRGGDAGLHEVSHGALKAHPHQERHIAPEPRDQEAHPRRRHLPGRQERAHAGDRPPELRSRQRMGIEEVSERHASGRVIMPKRMGLMQST